MLLLLHLVVVDWSGSALGRCYVNDDHLLTWFVVSRHTTSCQLLITYSCANISTLLPALLSLPLEPIVRGKLKII